MNRPSPPLKIESKAVFQKSWATLTIDFEELFSKSFLVDKLELQYC
jgi:hypothetical protein